MHDHTPRTREAGLRRTATVTLGVTAASIAAAVAFAGLAKSATEMARQSGTSTDDTTSTSSASSSDDSSANAPTFTDGGGSGHATSGGT